MLLVLYQFQFGLVLGLLFRPRRLIGSCILLRALIKLLNEIIMDEFEFWDWAYTYEACLTWQICGGCLINAVVIWPDGKYSYEDIACHLCGGLMITTSIVA